MRRAAVAVALALAGCTGSSAPPPPAQATLPGNTGGDDPGGGHHRADYEPCEPTVEDHAPGNHDRFKFEDPATGKIGFKNSAGAIVIKPIFHFAYEFGPGGVAAAVDAVTPFVFIDPSGRVIAKAYGFDNGPDYFQDGHARIVDANKKVGFIDDNGAIVIPPRFDDAASFCHGHAEVAQGGKTFVVDHTGKTVAP